MQRRADDDRFLKRRKIFPDNMPEHIFCHRPYGSFVIDLMEVSGVFYDSRNDTIKVILKGFTLDIPEPKDNALEKIIDSWKAVKGGR